MSEREKTDWDKPTSYMPLNPIILSDHELKAFLINPQKMRGGINFASDILNKDLTLSVIDRDQASIYGIQIECVEEWANLGFHNLAERRFVHLLAKLSINRSTGGIERFLQTASASASTDLQMMNNQTKPDHVVEQKTGHSIADWKKWFK